MAVGRQPTPFFMQTRNPSHRLCPCLGRIGRATICMKAPAACRPKRPERAYMNILQNVTRIILRSVSHLEMNDIVPGCEHELGGPRHALPALAL